MLILPVHMGETWEKTWVTHQNGFSHRLKYYLQLKTKQVGVRGVSYGWLPRKAQVNKGEVVMQI